MAAAVAANAEWSALVAFPVALVVCAVVALVYLFAILKVEPNAPLAHLESSWTFGESWATNVTLAAGLLSGLFGSSEVVTALVGENGKASSALATVGAAVAASFVAAGSLIVLASKTEQEEHLSVGGIVGAAAVTLAGGFGEIWVLFRAGERLDLGGWQDAAGVIAAAAALLLAWYAVRSVPAVVNNGKEPAAPKPSETLTAAHMMAGAIKAMPGVDSGEVDAHIERTLALSPMFDAPGPGSRHRRRTALL
jgi:hypothetical protein